MEYAISAKKIPDLLYEIKTPSMSRSCPSRDKIYYVCAESSRFFESIQKHLAAPAHDCFYKTLFSDKNEAVDFWNVIRTYEPNAKLYRVNGNGLIGENVFRLTSLRRYDEGLDKFCRGGYTMLNLMKSVYVVLRQHPEEINEIDESDDENFDVSEPDEMDPFGGSTDENDIENDSIDVDAETQTAKEPPKIWPIDRILAEEKKQWFLKFRSDPKKEWTPTQWACLIQWSDGYEPSWAISKEIKQHYPDLYEQWGEQKKAWARPVTRGGWRKVKEEEMQPVSVLFRENRAKKVRPPREQKREEYWYLVEWGEDVRPSWVEHGNLKKKKNGEKLIKEYQEMEWTHWESDSGNESDENDESD